MFDPAALIGLLKLHGLSLLAPLAVVEGPIVTVLAGWLSEAIGADLWQIALVVILGDLLGDLIFYAVGRAGPRLMRGLVPRFVLRRLRRRFAAARMADMTTHFETRGGRTLLLAKMTHSLGAAVLMAAGAARMDIWAFLGWNLIGTIPKSLLLLGLGAWIGRMSAQVSVAQFEIWLGRAIWGGAVLGLGIAVVWIWKRRFWKRGAGWAMQSGT